LEAAKITNTVRLANAFDSIQEATQWAQDNGISDTEVHNLVHVWVSVQADADANQHACGLNFALQFRMNSESKMMPCKQCQKLYLPVKCIKDSSVDTLYCQVCKPFRKVTIFDHHQPVPSAPRTAASAKPRLLSVQPQVATWSKEDIVDPKIQDRNRARKFASEILKLAEPLKPRLLITTIDELGKDKAHDALVDHLSTWSPDGLRDLLGFLRRLKTWWLSMSASIDNMDQMSSLMLAEFIKSRAKQGSTAPKSCFNHAKFLVTHLQVHWDLDDPLLQSSRYIERPDLEARIPRAKRRKRGPAVAFTIRMMFHFELLSESENEFVACLAALACLYTYTALRPSHGQRSTLMFEEHMLRGQAFRGKTSRQNRRPLDWCCPYMNVSGKKWWLPLQKLHASLEIKFWLPAWSPGGSIAKATKWRGQPARNCDVLAAWRLLMQMPPLSLSLQQAMVFTGYSARQFFPTVAKLSRMSRGERTTLGGWADGSLMVDHYGQQADRVLELESRKNALSSVRIAIAGDAGLDHGALPSMDTWKLLPKFDGDDTSAEVPVDCASMASSQDISAAAKSIVNSHYDSENSALSDATEILCDDSDDTYRPWNDSDYSDSSKSSDASTLS
jgi:hypothetical protein